MRVPRQLSYSSISLWEKDPREFYIRHNAETRASRLPQERFMSIGSAFDAYAKSKLHEMLFGKGADPKYEFDAIFTAQVEKHNRDWAREEGKYVFESYLHTGLFDELFALLSEALEPPRFEFDASGVIDGIPLFGKPDCYFIHKSGVHIVHDWKVKGYCSKYAQSPAKNFRICKDGYDAIALGVDISKKNPLGRQSLTHNKAHKWYRPYDHHGLEIHREALHCASREYADQLSIYAWLLGVTIGDQEFVASIDELVCKKQEGNRPLIRTSNNRARISTEYQLELQTRIKRCWDAINSGHIFPELSREESDEKCKELEATAVGLKTDGTSLENWFNEVVRPQFRK